MTDQDLCTYGNKCKNGSGKGELCSKCFNDLLDKACASTSRLGPRNSELRKCVFCGYSYLKDSMMMKEDNPCDLEAPIKMIYSCNRCASKYNLQEHEITWPPASWKEETL